MRCKNCGWPNKPQSKTCVKCHALLDSNEETADNYSAQNSINSGSDSSLKKTVLESNVFGNSRDENTYQSSHLAGNFYNEDIPSGPQAPETKTCPKCGYLLRPNTDKCPNCKFSVNQSCYTSNATRQEAATTYEECPPRRPTRMDNPGSNEKMRGTINPYMMNVELDPSFILKPLKRINERKGFDEQEYEGREVILNRDNTEASNSSITSREQAIVTRVDGHWFIEDKSEQKTTFVQASKKIELREGDIILLGNRLFEFHE